ncbi:tape-measure protein [Streptomyces bungoensis]|uniref:tape-measure protein n=1 Tax=Streptomyces bungoensis TaxID=285568 RepID=UPI0033C1B48C
MSSAAAGGVPSNLLAGFTSTIRSLQSRAKESVTAAKTLSGTFKDATTGVDRLRADLDQAKGAVSRSKAGAEAAARSVTRTGKTATTAASGVKSVGGRTRTAGKILGKLLAGLGGTLSVILGLIDVAGPLGDLLDKFGTAMTIGSGVMTLINLVTKANPIGFVTGILLPMAGWLLDLAMNSETGQRLMDQLAKLVLKYVESVLTVLAPVLKVIASVVGTYVSGYLHLIVGTLKVLSALIGTGFAVLKALTTGDTRALGGRTSAIWNGLRNAVQPVLDWLGKRVPQMFQRVKDALSGTLRGMGRFVTTGAQTVAGVVKGPIQGLVAFANWIIDGLNSLSFSFFGKKFGVHLNKIPMLAEGGIAVSGAHSHTGRVLPLTALDRQRALAARHRSAAAQNPHRIKEFHERQGAGAFGTAEDLLFLATAHARP